MKTSTIEQDKHVQTQKVLLGVQKLEKNSFFCVFSHHSLHILHQGEGLLTNTNILSRPSSPMAMAFRWWVDDGVNFQGGGGRSRPRRSGSAHDKHHIHLISV